MDYPDTDEMNYAKDDKDLNEYCTYHEMPYQDQRGIMTEDQIIDHQGMMTEDDDLLENSEIKTKNNIDSEIKGGNSKEIHSKSKINENFNLSDNRETPSGFI